MVRRTDRSPDRLSGIDHDRVGLPPPMTCGEVSPKRFVPVITVPALRATAAAESKYQPSIRGRFARSSLVPTSRPAAEANGRGGLDRCAPWPEAVRPGSRCCMSSKTWIVKA